MSAAKDRSSWSVRELDPRDQSLAAAIQRHLERSPEASDTVRGIQEWWLPPRHRARSPHDIEQILWTMVADGRLLASIAGDGTVLFARGAEAEPGR